MITEEKRTTGRAVMFNQFKIPFSYTVESSIGLYYQPQEMKTLPFNSQAWEEMGQQILKGLNEFLVAF
jgi:hypothetical protein